MSWSALEVQRRYSRLVESRYCRRDIFPGNPEREVQTHRLGSASGFPQPQHRLAGSANPQKRYTWFLEDTGEREPENVPVKRYSAVKAFDIDVSLKESLDGDHVR